MNYFLAFGLAFILSLVFSFLIRKIALKFNIVDDPKSDPDRKIQKKPIPLLGAVSIYLSFVLILLGFIFLFKFDFTTGVELKSLIGLILAGLVVIIGGIIDDKFNLPASRQIIFPIIAVMIIIAVGIGVNYITNPFGGLIYLDVVKIKFFELGGVPYFINLLSDIFTFLWLLTIIYTIKFFDGLDGLVAGISTIGGLVIAGLCLFTIFFQPEVAILSLIFAGACAGILILNFHPAKIFLGESSVFCGLMLGVLAIISGGKIATALLVLGIPLFDLVWVIGRRIFVDKKAPWRGDRKHLHFRLLDAGFSHRKAVLFIYGLSLIFGLSTLILPSFYKLLAIICLFIFMICLAFWLVKKDRQSLVDNSQSLT